MWLDGHKRNLHKNSHSLSQRQLAFRIQYFTLLIAFIFHALALAWNKQKCCTTSLPEWRTKSLVDRVEFRWRKRQVSYWHSHIRMKSMEPELWWGCIIVTVLTLNICDRAYILVVPRMSESNNAAREKMICWALTFKKKLKRSRKGDQCFS